MTRTWTVVIVVCLAFLGAIAYRMSDLVSTGFILPDEQRYIFDAIHGTAYGSSIFFGLLNIGLFRALGIGTLDSFLYLMPVYLFAFFAVTVLAFKLVLDELKLDEGSKPYALVAMLAVLPLIVLDSGFLTEGVALAFCMVGIWALLKGRSDWRYGLASAIAFAAATFTHPPYFAFLVLSALSLLRSVKSLSAYLSAAVPLGTYFILSMYGLIMPLVKTEGVGLELPNGAGIVNASSIPAMAFSSVLNIGVFVMASLVLGWGVLLLPALVGAIVCVKRRNYTVLTLCMTGIAAVAAIGVWDVRIIPWILPLSSTLFRYSQPSIPALLILMSFAIASLGSRQRKLAFLTGLVIASLLVGLIAQPIIFSQVLPYAGQSQAIAVRSFALAHPNQMVCAVGVEQTSFFPLTPQFVPHTWDWTPFASGIHNVVFANSSSLCPPWSVIP